MPQKIALKLSNSVLLDNTTIYGAAYAYLSWPPMRNHWNNAPYAINLRCLMDLLEAIILYDKLAIDISSRSYDIDSTDDDCGRIYFTKLHGVGTWWEDFYEPLTKGQVPQEVGIVEDIPDVVPSIVSMSLDLMEHYYRQELFQDDLALFRENSSEETVPVFYRGLDEFESLLIASFHNKLPLETLNKLKSIRQILRNAPASVANYEIFDLEVPLSVKTGLPRWLKLLLRRSNYLVFLRDVAR
jgi:hypothetical protein